jgi:hypothetical protein
MPTLIEIAESIDSLSERIKSTWVANSWDASTGLIALLGWNASVLSANDLCDFCTDVAARIRVLVLDELDASTKKFIVSILPRANLLQLQNIASDSDAVIGTVTDFLLWVDRGLPPRLVRFDWERAKDNSEMPRDLKRRLRSVEAHLAEIEPRAEDIQRKIGEIEAAHAAAEQLPTDMEDLTSQRAKVTDTANDVAKNALSIELAMDKVANSVVLMEKQADAAKKLVAQCEDAYRITTSKGLAGAFEARATKLTRAAWAWVTGLAIALFCIFLIGLYRFAALKDLMMENMSDVIISINVILSILSIGAPVWFAWISTKQIGQNFRLAEDYAFKASVAKAYEGYRREAASLDPLFEQRLFGSALTRLEEAPIRLVEARSFSSPLHEFISSDEIKKAFDTIPAFKEKIMELVNEAKIASGMASAGLIAAVTGRSEKKKENDGE